MPLHIPQNQAELLEGWLKRLRESQNGHYEAAKPLTRRRYLIGVPAIILSAVVSTSVFVSLQKEVNMWTKVITGFLSVSGVVLSALQTFFGFSDRVVKHQTVAAKCGSVRREIEQYFASGQVGNIPQDKIDQLRFKIDSIFETAPNIPNEIWEASISKLD